MEGRKSWRRLAGKKNGVRVGLLACGGLLALASFAWACVAHTDPLNTLSGGPDISVSSSGGTPADHFVVDNDKIYTVEAEWSGPFVTPPASGATYDLRASLNNGENKCGGVMNTSTHYEKVIGSSGQTPTGTPPSISGSWDPNDNSEPEGTYDVCVHEVGSSVQRIQNIRVVVLE